ncbi:MAG: hypothetical protein LC792_20905 [Actinobacteria bacterium]|nr:hypothetical protein [Actinomycetota bacterium]
MMADPAITDADEGRHPPGAGADWEESWYFDFVAAGGEVAGYARLTLRPGEGGAWWWSAVVGRDLPYVLVREHDVALPRAGTLEIRASGLWAEPICETPFEHWGLGLEAFAIALDDPTDAYGHERGDPIPLGLDLEWEPERPPAVWPAASGGRYGQAGAVHGEVLVGSRRFIVTGTGATEHAWGRRDWWPATPAAPDSGWLAGRLGPETAIGPGPDVVADLPLDDRGLLADGLVTAPDGAAVTVHPIRHAPLQVPAADGRISRLARALCRLEAGVGRTGWAWAERLQPASRTRGDRGTGT